MAMKLDQALKLYIGLYCLAFLMTWFISVPMLMHVSRSHECLLFVTPQVVYGPSTTCFLVGLIPMFVGLSAVILIALHVMQLRSLKAYLRNPGPHSSKDYHNRPTHIFWRMVVFHTIVTFLMLIVTGTVTAGYATTCQNLEQEVRLKIRSRIQADQYGGGHSINEAYDRYLDSRSIERYVNPNTDYFGHNNFERSITCRTLLTDYEVTRLLKIHHENNPLYRQFNSFYDQNQVADVGNIRYYTYRDNLVLELSLAGSWICLVVMSVILILMVTLRHQIRAHLTDESMWGGSEIGRRSISRISNASFDRRSHISDQSGSRYSANRSRGQRGSRAPSEQGSYIGKAPRGGRAPVARGHHQRNGHMSNGGEPPNNLLAYFAENPPVEEEVDVDAALNDQSLELPNESAQFDSSKDVQDTSFGSEGIPVPMVHDYSIGDPIPLGDEVSEGLRSLNSRQGNDEIDFNLQYQEPVTPSNPNRVTGRRGGRSSFQGMTRTPQPSTQSHNASIGSSRQSGNYRTRLGNQSFI